jgi:hypothetical protein
LALSPIEKQSVLGALYSERFQDKTPYEAYATLLDDGVYQQFPLMTFQKFFLAYM